MRWSIVIPTLNEASCLGETLAGLRRHQPWQIIVADGGSDDATRELARSGADVLVEAPPGRAGQMNAGAARATGDLLLFLHADCSLEPGALEIAARHLARPEVAAGCFRMRVRDPAPVYRFIDLCATMRVWWTGLVYGDQGLFLTRRLFEHIGGFPPVRFMEDVWISRQLRCLGHIVVAARRIEVSPRRWKKQGIVRQTLRNWTLTALAGFGVHPDRLAEYYPPVR
jgi:rSAM/selenodomain-associated transferase 2